MALDYISLNQRLAGHFFRPEFEGRRVFLYVTPDLLAQIAGAAEATQDFVTAIKAGPPGTTRQGLCQRALQTLERWQDRVGTPPPYLGYLGLFVLAAGVEGDFAAHAYYPRLRQLLGEEPLAGQYPSFNRMWELWVDLERWANEDQAGRLGSFKADVAGDWMHVGMPIAQTILTQHERDSLPQIFAECGLDPEMIPTDEQLAQMLIARGHNRLRHRTLQILEFAGNGDATLRDILLQTVLEELEDWDGQYATDQDQERRLSGALRLCCQLDRVAARARITVRCRSAHELPDAGLALRCEPLTSRLVCQDHAFGWSTDLVLSDQMAPVDGAALDWVHGATARNDGGGWVFRLSAAQVRIFEPGNPYAIPGLVECSRPLRKGEFYLVCHSGAAGLIAAWGAAECTSFEEIPINSGLPPGWRMFAASEPRSDEQVRHIFPMLSFNQSLRIRTEGGIHHARNRYFTFAPPHILLDGADIAVTLWGNNTALEESPRNPGTYEIPSDLARPGRLLLESKRTDGAAARRSVYFSDEPLSALIEPPRCDVFGQYSNGIDPDPWVCGTEVSITPQPFAAFFLPELPTTRRVILLGAQPGQVAVLPQDPYPADWHPVWAVPMERRGHAIFCGRGIDKAEPCPAISSDRRQIKRWREILWHWRRRITPPSHGPLARLWERYQEAARNL